jgi:GNAT superfamily N-acetyltransferase
MAPTNPYPGVDGAIAHALLAINDRYEDRPLIPPTAINWLAPELAAAVNAHTDAEHVETRLEVARAYRDRGYREAMLRAMRAELWEWVMDNGYTLAARPTVEVRHHPDWPRPGYPPLRPANPHPLTDDQLARVEDTAVLEVQVRARLRLLPEL